MKEIETKQTVLQYLAQHPNEWTSSKQLVETLNISRTAVWKAIKLLQEQNYQIDSQAGKGYLFTPNQTLSDAIIRNKIDPRWHFEVHDQVNSTNLRAKELAAHLPIKQTVVVANEQTTGYGRFGRHFYSPSDTGIYISFLLPVTQTDFDPGLLTTGVAVAAAQAIEKQYPVNVKIKWVNDLIVNDHKVAGILSEAIADVESRQISSVIVGIGINLAENDVVPADLRQKVGAITEDNQQLDRNQTVVNVINEVSTLVDHPEISYMQRYRERCMVIGEKATVRIGNEQFDGRVETINDDGALVLNTKKGTQVVSAGEITKLNLKEGKYHG